MLAGEHAVLRGHPALIAAAHQRLHVAMRPSHDGQFHVHSNLGTWSGQREAFPVDGVFRFASAVLRAHLPLRALPVIVDIQAEFSSTVGLGSSAALVVALVAACHAAEGRALSREAIFRDARSIIQTVQGSGSGGDAAASTFGGVTLLDPVSLTCEALPAPPEVVLVYCGHKMPTPDVIRMVNSWERQHPEAAARIFQQIAIITRQCAEACRARDWYALGRAMNSHQLLQENLHLMDPDLTTIHHALRAHPKTLGCKISGSGLGDCMVAVGLDNIAINGYETIPVRITEQGVTVDKI